MRRVFLLLILPLLLLACQSKPKKLYEISGSAQGTTYHIKFYTSGEGVAKSVIDSLLDDFDKVASLYDEESLISRFNARDTLENPGLQFVTLVEKSKEVHRRTDGAFDFTIGQLVKAWGFWKSESLNPDTLMVDSLLKLTGDNKVILSSNKKILTKSSGVLIDFNAIAQGYSVDLICDMLVARGISDFIVEVGGEVRSMGKHADGNPFTVGIERPAKSADAPQQLYKKAVLENKSMATSGSSRKFYVKDGVKYSHTIDPKTGFPVSHTLLSVSVLADNCTDADAYATAFMVLGLDKSLKILKSLKNMDAFFIYSDAKGDLKDTCTAGFLKILKD